VYAHKSRPSEDASLPRRFVARRKWAVPSSAARCRWFWVAADTDAGTRRGTTLRDNHPRPCLTDCRIRQSFRGELPCVIHNQNNPFYFDHFTSISRAESTRFTTDLGSRHTILVSLLRTVREGERSETIAI
jgi:hypothetical protein